MKSKWFFVFFWIFLNRIRNIQKSTGPRLVQAVVMKSENVWIYVSFWAEKHKLKKKCKKKLFVIQTLERFERRMFGSRLFYANSNNTEMAALTF